MLYRVALADSAKADASAIYERIVDAAPLNGPVWFEALLESLYLLEKLPYRCPLAREAHQARREIRCLLFGKRRNVYRILYEVDDSMETVWILHIRHGAMRDLKASEIAARPSEGDLS
jgi:plasmid stabilization system protein ParE